MKILTKPWFYIPLSILTITLAVFSTIDLVKKNKKSVPKIQADFGRIIENKYINNYLGWEFTIPEGYDTIPNHTRDSRIKKGAGKNFDAKSAVKLLGIKNKENESSKLTSSLDIRSYFPEIKNAADYFDLTKELLEKQFQKSESTFNMTKHKTQIDGVDFNLVELEYKKNNKLFYLQRMYFKLYEDYILTISLSSDNITDFDILVKNLTESKFIKKSSVHNTGE